VPETQSRETLAGEPTVPYVPTFDTGDFEAQPDPAPMTEAAPSEPTAPPAQPVIVAGTYHYLKRWTFVLVVAGSWIVAAAIGAGLYYWWYHTMNKTWPVFVVLLYLIVCTVGSLLIAMVQNKPLVSALAIAVMSAPLASTAAAAALYGAYVFHWIQR
jgi:hypothetical protein